MDILWLLVDQNPLSIKSPRYKRTFGSLDGKVAFVPAWVSGFEGSTVLMCASFDGARIAIHRGKTYFDADWMLSEYPRSAVAIQNAQQSLNDYIERSTK